MPWFPLSTEDKKSQGAMSLLPGQWWWQDAGSGKWSESQTRTQATWLWSIFSDLPSCLIASHSFGLTNSFLALSLLENTLLQPILPALLFRHLTDWESPMKHYEKGFLKHLSPKYLSLILFFVLLVLHGLNVTFILTCSDQYFLHRHTHYIYTSKIWQSVLII